VVINSRATKRFAEAIKTDAVDACGPVQSWQCPDALVLTIRACAHPIAALNKLQTQTKNQPQAPNSPRRHQTS